MSHIYSAIKSRRLAVGLASALALPIVSASASAQTPTRPVLLDTVQGTLYAKGTDSSKPLFRFVRTADERGGEIHAHLRYNYVDGRPAVRERVTYENGQVTSYTEHNLQNGSHGQARIERADGKVTVHFSFTPHGAKASARHNVEHLGSDGGAVIVDDNVVPFMLHHWNALQQGKSVGFRYVVVSRTETVACDLTKAGDTTWQGVPAVDIAMAPSGFFAGMLVDPVHFIVAKAAPHHVLAYQGRTMPKIQRDGDWKSLDALTVFQWKPQGLAGPAEASERYETPRTAVGTKHSGRSG